MNNMLVCLTAMALSLLSCPARAQDSTGAEQGVQVHPWQDHAAGSNSTSSTKQGLSSSSYRYTNTQTALAGVANKSVNQTALNSGQYTLGFPAPGPQTGKYGSVLPPVATSSMNLSICVVVPPPPDNDGSDGSAASTANLPPAPGPGYQPIFQHGVFVGYMSPDLISLMQTDPTTAWTDFANSSDFVGPEGLRLSLLAETGAASPEQMAELDQMALFGM